MHARHIGWGVVPALALGCGSGALTENGDLGNGTFTYNCVDTSDIGCQCSVTSDIDCLSPSSGTLPFPQAVALGGRFRLQFQPGDSIGDVGQPTIAAIAPEYLSVTDSVLLTLKPGLAGLFAASTIDGSFVDYQLVPVVVPLSLQVSQDGNVVAGTASVSVGAKSTFTVVPLGESSAQIAGALYGTWATSDASVAALSTSMPSDTLDITGLAAGTATITVTSPGNVPPATFTVEVQ